MIVIVLVLFYGGSAEPAETARSVAVFDTLEACEVVRAAEQPAYRRIESLASARAGVPARLHSACMVLPAGVAL